MDDQAKERPLAETEPLAMEPPRVESKSSGGDSSPAGGESGHRRRPSRLRWYLLVLGVLLGIAVFNRTWIASIPNAWARDALARRDLAAAQRWLDWSRRLASRNAETEFLLARAARHEGKLGLVAGHLQRARQLGHPADIVQREEWLTDAQSGRLRDVMPRLPDLLRESPSEGNDICEAFIFGIMKSKNHFRTAFELLSIWISDHPAEARPHYLLGRLSVEIHDLPRAEKEFREALTLDPADSQSAFALANLLWDSQKADEAAEYLDIAAADPSLRFEAMVRKARCLRMADDRDAARTALDGLLTEEPASVEANLVMAQLELDASQFAEARQRLEPILRAEPRNAEICETLALALTGLDEEEAARRLTATANDFRMQLNRSSEWVQQLVREPGNLALRFQIGRAHLLFGDPDTGVDWLLGLLDLDSNHRLTLELLATFYESKPDQTPEEWQLSRKYRRQLETDR